MLGFRFLRRDTVNFHARFETRDDFFYPQRLFVAICFTGVTVGLSLAVYGILVDGLRQIAILSLADSSDDYARYEAIVDPIVNGMLGGNLTVCICFIIIISLL